MEKEEKDKRPQIGIRYKELEDQGLGKREIVKTLHQEGYSTFDMMQEHLPIQYIKEPKGETEEAVMRSLGGSTKPKGYLMELEDTFAHVIMKDKELTKSFYGVGIASLLAALQKSGLAMDDFRKIATDSPPEGTRSAIESALQRAGDTIFKALESYQADVIPKIEQEREEARLYASMLEGEIDKLKKSMDPLNRMETMIVKLTMLSGTSKMDPLVINELLDRWLGMQIPAIFSVEATV